jgi:serine/threonine protein phosphatase PrpC
MPPLFGVTTTGESVVGGRHSQEDRFIIESNFNSLLKMRGDGKRRIFAAVFDGHGGEECSEFLSKRFVEELADHPEIQTDPQAALKDVWNKVMIAVLNQGLLCSLKNTLTKTLTPSTPLSFLGFTYIHSYTDGRNVPVVPDAPYSFGEDD